MTWVKLEDGFFTNPKATAVGPLGRELYLAGLCYCAQHLTDGLIHTHALTVLLVLSGAKPSTVDLLVKEGLWEIDSSGWQVHDFAAHQRSRAQVEAERERARVRQASRRDGTRDAPRDFARSSGTEERRVEKNTLTGVPTTPPLGPHDKRKIAGKCPDGWGVTGEMHTWVEDRCPLIDWRLQTERFLAWADSKGAKYQDWDRAWDNWMLKAQDDQTARTPRAAVR